MALLAGAGLTYAYFYLQRSFAPSPFDGIRRDAMNRAAITGAPEEPKFGGTVGLITSAPKADRSNRANGAPSAQSMTLAPTIGASQPRVTHTHPGPTANKPPEDGPRGNVSHDQPRSGACPDAVAALGLCKPQAKAEAR
ncbi:MAG: hypothetical protein WCA09_06315 [Burkholderiales bacterium]